MKNAEALKAQSRQKRLQQKAVRAVELQAEEARKEARRLLTTENKYLKEEKKMLAQQQRGSGGATVNSKKSDLAEGKLVIQVAENSKQMVPTVLPENEKRKASDADEKEYEYKCSDCGTWRLVKGKKPGPGWDCADGGYACRRHYECKLCNRPLLKEGDPSDEYECKDVGRQCRPSKKQKK